MAQRVKHLPAMWETQVRSLGRDDSPGEGNGESRGWGSLVGYSPQGHRVGHDWATSLSGSVSLCVSGCGGAVRVTSTDFWGLPSSPSSGSRCLLSPRYPPRHPSSEKLPKPGLCPHGSGPACCLPLQARPMEAGRDSADGTPAHRGPALPQVALWGAGTQRPKAMCWQNAEGQSLGQVHPKGPGTGDKARGKGSARGLVKTRQFSLKLWSTHFGAFSLAQAPSQALQLILYSEFDYFFFPKELPKFHKLQVPQNLNLF